MRKIRRVATFLFDLLQFESRETFNLSCFATLPNPP